MTLFIGGPCDGVRRQFQGDYTVAARWPKMSLADGPVDPDDTVTYERACYVRRHMDINGRRFEFAAPESMKMQDAIALLFEHYRPPEMEGWERR